MWCSMYQSKQIYIEKYVNSTIQDKEVYQNTFSTTLEYNHERFENASKMAKFNKHTV